MSLSGGNWLWSASLRYLFTLPLLLLIVQQRRGLSPLLANLRQFWKRWLLWSSIGFGLFYAPLCFAASFGPAWLVSGTWQLTIVAGSLMGPWLQPKDRKRVPISSLVVSLGIIGGICLMQFGRSEQIDVIQTLLIVVPLLLAAFAYPLGNRMMMAHCGAAFDTFARMLGMTIASLPIWLALAVLGLAEDGLPAMPILGQSLVVALFSGIIATGLFFSATNLARRDPRQLAAVEATQSLEVVFSLLGEMILLHAVLPDPMALLGMAIVIIGMFAHSLLARQASAAAGTV